VETLKLELEHTDLPTRKWRMVQRYPFDTLNSSVVSQGTTGLAALYLMDMYNFKVLDPRCVIQGGLFQTVESQLVESQAIDPLPLFDRFQHLNLT
jgi:hypothetical protein